MNLSPMMNYILELRFILTVSLFLGLGPSIDPLYANAYEEYMWEDCDLCGCATSSGGVGFTNLNNTDFIGIRGIYQSFESKDGIFNNSPTIKEEFYTYQIWGKKQVTDFFSVSGVIPFLDLNRRFEDGQSQGVSGLGDISLIGWYHFNFKKKKSNNQTVFEEATPSNHSLQLGLGLKLPTGDFKQELAENQVNPGFQVGTGSLDYIVSAFHSYTRERWGLSTNLTYFFKTENNENYRFGNQISLSTRVFTFFEFKKTVWMPFVGITFDHFNEIEEFGQVIPNTDGYVANAMLGTEVSLNEMFTLGSNFSLPIQQELVGGDVKAEYRFSLYLNYRF